MGRFIINPRFIHGLIQNHFHRFHRRLGYKVLGQNDKFPSARRCPRQVKLPAEPVLFFHQQDLMAGFGSG
jgi:hypothetical protein